MIVFSTSKEKDKKISLSLVTVMNCNTYTVYTDPSVFVSGIVVHVVIKQPGISKLSSILAISTVNITIQKKELIFLIFTL